MTDLQLLDKYCDTCLDFIHPTIYREIERRGLVSSINRIGTLVPAEAKAIIRARLSKNGRYTGDPEIEQIASVIDRLEALRSQLVSINITSAFEIKAIADEMAEHSQFLIDYYK